MAEAAIKEEWQGARMRLQNIRGSYVYVRKPHDRKNGREPRYEFQVIMPKDHPQREELDARVKWVAANHPKTKGTKFSMLKVIPRDGDAERDSEEYEGHVFFNTSADLEHKPGIVNRQGETPTEDELDRLCGSGCYFNVSINLFGYDTDGNKGVSAGLRNVMLWRRGKRLDGGVSAASEFKDWATDETDVDDDLNLDDDDLPF